MASPSETGGDRLADAAVQTGATTYMETKTAHATMVLRCIRRPTSSPIALIHLENDKEDGQDCEGDQQADDGARVPRLRNAAILKRQDGARQCGEDKDHACQVQFIDELFPPHGFNIIVSRGLVKK